MKNVADRSKNVEKFLVMLKNVEEHQIMLSNIEYNVENVECIEWYG